MNYFHELDSYYDNLIPASPRPHIDRRFAAELAGIMALGIAVAFGTPVAVEAYRGHQTAQVEAAAAMAARAPAELPREWRWEPQTVKFEHMYMSKR